MPHDMAKKISKSKIDIYNIKTNKQTEVDSVP